MKTAQEWAEEISDALFEAGCDLLDRAFEIEDAGCRDIPALAVMHEAGTAMMDAADELAAGEAA